VGLKHDLDGQLASFSALTLIGSSDLWKPSSEMTYKVSSGTLSLAAHVEEIIVQLSVTW